MAELITLDATNATIMAFRPQLNTMLQAYSSSLDVAAATKKAYLKAVSSFLVWSQEQGQAFAPQAVIAYKAHLLETKSTYTVNFALSAIRSFFKFTSANGLSNNIAATVRSAKNREGFAKDNLSEQQAVELLQATSKDSLRDAAIVRLMLNCGLRACEVQRANIEDLRTKNGKQVLFVQGKKHVHKDNFVVLPKPVYNAISAYLKGRKDSHGQAPLFTSTSNRNKGGRLTTHSIARVVRGGFKQAGIEGLHITPHSLRHTAITFALLGGATIQQAQTMARHKNINTTLIYSHNIERTADNAPELLASNYISKQFKLNRF